VKYNEVIVIATCNNAGGVFLAMGCEGWKGEDIKEDTFDFY
jgi:hypothetical protein